MLQPFVLFRKTHLITLLQVKKFYLVTQSYARAFDHFAGEVKTDILITDYDKAGLAYMHFNAVKADLYGAIIRINRDDHKNKLLEMLDGEKYRLFWAVTQSNKDIKRKLEVIYPTQIRKYIDIYTGWRVKGGETVNVDGIEVTFGELFVTLKWKTQKLRIKFEDIEKA